MYQIERARRAAEVISEAGGVVVHEHQTREGRIDLNLEHPVTERFPNALDEKWFITPYIVVLSGRNVSDEDLRTVSDIGDLRQIDISHTPITNQGLEYIAKVSTLEILNLMKTHISDDGLKHLAKLRNLRDLDIRLTMVTDRGLKYLSVMSSLKQVWVTRGTVTQEGLDNLSQSLPDCVIEFQ